MNDLFIKFQEYFFIVSGKEWKQCFGPVITSLFYHFFESMENYYGRRITVLEDEIKNMKKGEN